MADTGILGITLLDVLGGQAVDTDTEIRVVRLSDNRTIAEEPHATFPPDSRMTLPSFPLEQGLVAWITPIRFRMCHSEVFTLTDGQVLPAAPHVFRHPNKWSARCTHWTSLGTDFGSLKTVLSGSPDVFVFEGHQPLGTFAGDRYDDVDTPKALLAKTAMLNLYAKMGKVSVPDAVASSWFEFVNQVLAIGRERVIALAHSAMWDRVARIFANIGNHPDFVRADSVLHRTNIPESYRSRISAMVSIKSHEAIGNLQLTMAKSTDDQCNPVFILDADMDEHLDVLHHASDLFTHIFSGGTHPYDIHEFLLDRYGALDLGYDLV
jgi:hypothetical protein